MTGVFGIVDPHDPTHIEQRLKAMGQVMSHYEWYQVESSVYPQIGLGLGRIGIGIFNKEPQPIWNSEHTVAVLMAGEFYDTDRKKQSFGGEISDEALVLELYHQEGECFIEGLQGAFILAIWDAQAKRLLIANDRFGLYPTLMARMGDRLIFAPEIKALLLHPEFDRSLRDDAIAEYFRFQRLLGWKTFFKSADLLPPASILKIEFDPLTYEQRQYWNISHTPLLPKSTTFEEAVEEGSRLLRAAIERMSLGQKRLGVYLSGGLDSRGILGMIPSEAGRVHSFTYGQPGSRDEHYAQQIARRAGSHHHYHPFSNGGWIRQYFNTHLTLTEGFHNWLHMHGISMLDEVRQHVDVNISGLGDIIWVDQEFFPLSLIRAPDDFAFNVKLFELYNQKYSWPGIAEAEERYLYHESFYPKVEGLAFESLTCESNTFAALPYLQRAHAFNNINHFSRHLIYHVVYGRSHVEYRLPYFDLNLHTFCYSLQLEPGEDRNLQLAIISQALPALARIPRSSDELPIADWNQPIRLSRIVRGVKHRINRYVKPVFPTHQTLYADYEHWLRTDLRGWAETILMDERTLSRGIFRPEAVRSLLDRHFSGVEHELIGKIAPLITFEMMLRKYVD